MKNNTLHYLQKLQGKTNKQKNFIVIKANFYTFFHANIQTWKHQHLNPQNKIKLKQVVLVIVLL